MTEISNEQVYYTLFAPNVVYHKRLKDVVWNERNWRWETSGLGSMRKLEQVPMVKQRNRRDEVPERRERP